jgi:nitroreductase
MSEINQHAAFLRSLRAVRRYADRPIERAVLEEILEVARWTGSGKNRQPWELVVVEERAALAQLAVYGQFAKHLAGAAAAVVLVMEDASRRFDEGRLAQNLMLAAWTHGIGSCMATFSTDEDAQRGRELLGIPVDRWFHNSIAFGYPADDPSNDPGARFGRLPADVVPRGRKPLDSFLHWERYGPRGP